MIFVKESPLTFQQSIYSLLFPINLHKSETSQLLCHLIQGTNQAQSLSRIITVNTNL